jgi:N-acetylmuramoyl-L-alanine amidase
VLPIRKKIIRYNYSGRNDEKIKYIVIHDTGNRARGADAEAHYRYFNSGNMGASAHYFVDDRSILQLVEDCHASWHCGDGKGRYGITNRNSIGVEICVNADGDYEKAVANTLKLVKYLMKKHAVPLERVVRHYDASRKLCPGSMSEDNWSRWQEFKKNLEDKPVIELQKAVAVLHERGIINTPEYWLKNAVKGKMLKGEYAALLIQRTAEFIEP